ncbi:hypothetical protein TSOC_011909 [Tetrabaena socialis]|uniref:Uncharacterized protein n=1 Tax=Tetrabaena socialis TaxID=47790 RepID=A0A2J7ZPH9_9CHLO|nr:hypothetical protein TSOC_011909 [Tetrabaena socialis]|eukprot:PNH02152.1 hypothetical protein TSOC_011909 [Tetrabaena socialis]
MVLKELLRLHVAQVCVTPMEGIIPPWLEKLETLSKKLTVQESAQLRLLVLEAEPSDRPLYFYGSDDKVLLVLKALLRQHGGPISEGAGQSYNAGAAADLGLGSSGAAAAGGSDTSTQDQYRIKTPFLWKLVQQLWV